MASDATAESIKLQFQNVKQKTFENLAKIQRAVFFDISKRVIESTPVDTGRARGGWHADVDRFSPASKDFRGSSGGATAEAMASVSDSVARHKIGQDLTLGNGVSYISYLNSGSSKQAPAGMTDAAINAYAGVVEVATRTAL